MQNLKARHAFLVGIVLLVAGFLYEVFLNGVPYPDPTPELTARWEFHETVAKYVYLAGLLVMLAGVARFLFGQRFRR